MRSESALTPAQFAGLSHLLSQHAAALLRSGDVAALTRWMRAVPAALRRAEPELGMWLAWAVALGKSPLPAEEIADEAERALGPAAPGSDALRAQLNVIRAMVARRTGRASRARRLLALAARQLPTHDPVIKAVIAMERGRLSRPEAAQNAYAEAVAQADLADHPLLRASALLAMSQARRAAGRHAEADASAARAGRLAALQPTRGLADWVGTGLSPAPGGAGGITRREHDILAGLRNGWTDRQLAEALAIAPSTVRWHCRQLYRKLGVRSRAQAVALLTPPQN